MDDLTKVSHKLAEEIYKAASAKQQSQNASQGPDAGREQGGQEEPKQDSKKDEDIIDAEYKEEGDGKNK